MKKSIEVTVCAWDPKHTLTRVEAQQRAIADGTIAKLAKKHGRGTEALREALQAARLISIQKSLDGSIHCPDCGCLMDTVLASPGVVDKIEAYRDVADDFAAAVTRTRQAR